VKELLKLDSICQSYAQMEGSSFLTHSIDFSYVYFVHEFAVVTL